MPEVDLDFVSSLFLFSVGSNDNKVAGGNLLWLQTNRVADRRSGVGHQSASGIRTPQGSIDKLLSGPIG